MGKARILIRMVQSTLGNGLRTSRMETVPKHGRTVHNTTVSTSKARSTAKENFFGTMVQVIAGNSLQMIFMVMVTTHGRINGNTRASGNKTRCMVMAFSPGVMAKSTKGLTSMI